MNRIWDLREQGLVTSLEGDLYCYLVHRSNRLGWKNPFNQSSDVLCAVLGINRNSLSRRRRRLCEMGLIRFREGETKTRPAEYELCEVQSIARKTLSRKRTEKALPELSKPDLLAVESFCRERKSVVEAQAFYSYYEARGWVINGKAIADWKSVLMKWEARRTTLANKSGGVKYSKSISNVEF